MYMFLTYAGFCLPVLGSHYNSILRKFSVMILYAPPIMRFIHHGHVLIPISIDLIVWLLNYPRYSGRINVFRLYRFSVNN